MIDITKSKVALTLVHPQTVLSCRFSPCGKFVFGGAIDRLIVRWELATQQKTTWSGHTSWVGALAVATKPDRLFSSDYHGRLIAWPIDAASSPPDAPQSQQEPKPPQQPKPLWKVDDAHAGWIRALATSPDGATVASCGADKVVRLWDSATGQRRRELTGHDADVFSVVFHPSGEWLASGDLLGRVKVWNVKTGESARQFDAKPLHTRGDEFNFIADVGGVRGLAFSPDGKKLLCGGMTDAESNTFCPGKPALLELDFESGQVVRTLRIKEKSDGPLNAARWLPDGVIVAQGEGQNGGALSFWSAGQNEAAFALKGQSGYDLDLHPDGRRLASTVFKPKGRGGNGRHASPAEYVANEGAVEVVELA